ncbi:MAG: hypothetical protein COB08_005585 [Rhodobacteraceae bacterium]|nr:hypothetical protein [Paracoccaceae bacterium]
MQTTLPSSDEFRKWIDEVSGQLGISGWKLSQLAGMPNNAMNKFMSGAQKDMTLTTARKIVDAALLLATKDGVSISCPAVVFKVEAAAQ